LVLPITNSDVIDDVIDDVMWARNRLYILLAYADTFVIWVIFSPLDAYVFN